MGTAVSRGADVVWTMEALTGRIAVGDRSQRGPLELLLRRAMVAAAQPTADRVDRAGSTRRQRVPRVRTVGDADARRERLLPPGGDAVGPVAGTTWMYAMIASMNLASSTSRSLLIAYDRDFAPPASEQAAGLRVAATPESS